MFAAIASGNPLQMSEEVPNSNGMQHTIVSSSTKPKNYSHISLFILPNVTFPAEYIATVYFKLTPTEDFKSFGYLSTEKPSAIFKVKLPQSQTTPTPNDGLGEIDMGDDDDISMPANGPTTNHNISQLIIGISIENRNEGMTKIMEWKQQQQLASSTGTNSLVLARGNNNSGINTVGQSAKVYPLLTQELAGKIVQHAYNYLTGFLDDNGNVSIKRFDGWWDKFKNRLANDGSFSDEVTAT